MSTVQLGSRFDLIDQVMPEHIHDRCPIIMGGGRDVNAVLKLYE